MTDYKPPEHEGLDILYQDDYLLILNKPAGLLSVPGRGDDKQDCLISRVQAEYPGALIVHRLDMATSGLMLIALGKELERKLSILFQKRKVNKKYVALVNGHIKPACGEINLPLVTDWPNRPKQKVDFITGKPSRTKYKLKAYDAHKGASRVELTPVTGRTHQLRLHMQAINHPILGDELYADNDALSKAERLLLHASFLSFHHPVSDEILTFESRPGF